MSNALAGFDWDEGNWPKCGKHGVSREEIEELFNSSPAIMNDPHEGEPRIRAIGKVEERYIFLVFMYREIDGEMYIRPISARYMQREIKYYESIGS